MTLAPPTPADMEKVENYYLSLLTAAGDDDQAVAFLEKKLGEEPNDLDRLAMLAQLQAKQGHFDQALRAYEQMARAQPEVKTNWYTVGVLCWERSNKAVLSVSPEERAEVIAQGLDALDRALALDPEYTEAIAYKNLLYREKADALSKAGNSEEAKAALDEALRLRDQAMQLMQKKKAQSEAPPSDH
jgi:tetratricopeptide (TPR) repeat protein